MGTEDKAKFWGGRIGATVTFGIMSMLAGLLWSWAIGFDAGAGALWGAIIGGGIVFVLSIGISKQAVKGMGLMLGGLWLIVMVVGLIVGLLR